MDHRRWESDGSVDSWDAMHPVGIRLTWGHDPFPADPTVACTWRVDYGLYRGAARSPGHWTSTPRLLTAGLQGLGPRHLQRGLSGKDRSESLLEAMGARTKILPRIQRRRRTLQESADPE